MAVESKISALRYLEAFPGKEILERLPTSLMERLNALFEGLGDEGAPGAASQNYAGHNHGSSGGSPIPRSSILCMDLGSSYTGYNEIAGGTLATKNLVASHEIGPRYISPGLASAGLDATTDLLLSLSVIGGPLKVWGGILESFAVEVQPSSAVEFKWISLQVPILEDNGFFNLSISFKSTSTSSTTYSVRTLDEVENALSLPSLGSRPLRASDNFNSGTILSYFGTGATLDSELVNALESLDAYTLKILFWSLNALFEQAMDAPAPGTIAQAVKGHDHYKIADGGFGATPIPAGRIFSMGAPEFAPAIWDLTTVALNVWQYADKDYVFPMRRSSGTPDPATGAGLDVMFEAFVSAGVTSSGSPPASNPFLIAKLYTVGATGEVRIFNHTIATLSPVVTIASGWTTIEKIPCIGDQWNEFTVQYRSTGTVGTFKTRSLLLFETYVDAAGDPASIVDSSGSGPIGVYRGRAQNAKGEGA